MANIVVQLFLISPDSVPDILGRSALKRLAGQYDGVVNIESLSFRSDVERQLKSIKSLLRAGGSFFGSAILSQSEGCGWRRGRLLGSTPVTDCTDFRMYLERAGFSSVKVMDVTEKCWVPFHRRLSLFTWERVMANELDKDLIDKVKERLLGGCDPVSAYIIFIATK